MDRLFYTWVYIIYPVSSSCLRPVKRLVRTIDQNLVGVIMVELGHAEAAGKMSGFGEIIFVYHQPQSFRKYFSAVPPRVRYHDEEFLSTPAGKEVIPPDNLRNQSCEKLQG